MRSLSVYVLIIAFFSTAHSQVRPLGFEVGVNAGVWEGDAVYESGPMFGGQLRYNLTHLFGIEASYHTVLSRALEREQAAISEPRDANLGLVGLDAVIHLRDGRFVPFIVAGLASIIDDESYLGSNAGAGAVYYINERVGARVDIRGWFSGDAPSTDRFHHIGASAGVFVRFMGNDDRDGDGIKDADDQCLYKPEDRDEFEDTDGCPDPDNDEDKILDVDDKCPLKPEDMDGDADEDGCPEETVAIDTDKDGIPDEKDRCPKQPELKNGIEDEDGCPEKKVIITKDKIVIKERVFFELDKAVIKEESYEVLNAVASVMTKNAFVELVEIQGHTDNRGTDEYNDTLSQKRADAVRTFLIKTGGVSADRLTSKGYGKSKPVAEGDNEDAYAKNRRVEFVIIKQAEQAPEIKYVPLGPDAAKKAKEAPATAPGQAVPAADPKPDDTAESSKSGADAEDK
ncbi:MAG: OmpA family protein [Myxococcota bacterium]|nr:OmpA family protein [Myxococcota bacterium]